MPAWTEGILKAHRERMGWPPLDDDIMRGVIEMLQDVTDGAKKLPNDSWSEPAVRFGVAWNVKRKHQ